MNRQPPQAIAAEQSVLGGLMLPTGPEAQTRKWAEVSDLLTAESFYRRDHQLIFRALMHLEAQRLPFDCVTVGEFLDKQGMGELVGNGGYLIELASTTPSAANIRAYAEIVADKARLRGLIEAGTAMVANGFDPEGRSADEIIADAQSSVSMLALSRGHRLKSVSDGLSEMVAGMERRLEVGGMIGTSYGLPEMDEMTGGKQPGDLIIIAARPSMGKTTLALQGCMAAGRPLIFSFETMAEKLLARMTANVGKLPLRWILMPHEAPEFAFSRIAEASKIVSEKLTASIYDGRRLPFQQLRSIALREHDKSPVREVVIDHFGHMKRDGKGRADQEQGEDMKDLKALAREMGVPVIVLMQLNRGVESRADKRPMLSDLRECGAAEEDADVVAMLYRDAYYNPESPIRKYAEIFLRKNRDGDPGEIWTEPCLPEMRFDPAEPQERPNSGYANPGGNRGPTQGRSAGLKPRLVSGVGVDM